MSAPPQTAQSLAERVDALLAQTQCTKCGFDGCRPYAEAVAASTAAHNRCVPGGAAGIERLSTLLGCAPLPLDPDCGVESARRVAWIDPSACIGCTKCIAACPVDAIIGAQKRMHAVIAQRCTGCDLCLAPCPVDCIEMRLPAEPLAWTEEMAARARRHYESRQARLARERDLQSRSAPGAQRKRTLLESALRRARDQLERIGQSE